MDEFELIRWLDVLVETGNDPTLANHALVRGRSSFLWDRQQAIQARCSGGAGEALRDGQCRLIGLF